MALTSKIIYTTRDLTVTLVMHPDTDANPHEYEYDCYSNADINAWSRDEWQYVGVECRVEFRGVSVGADYLWGIEEGVMPSGTVDAFSLDGPAAEIVRMSFVDAWKTDSHALRESINKAHSALFGEPFQDLPDITGTVTITVLTTFTLSAQQAADWASNNNITLDQVPADFREYITSAVNGMGSASEPDPSWSVTNTVQP